MYALRGEVNGDIALRLPLATPDALQLEINALPRFSQVVYQPLDLRLRSVEGDLAWLQDGERLGLVGEASGQLLGGQIAADIHTHNDTIKLQGDVATSALFALAGLDNSQGRLPLEGQLRWQGNVSLMPTPTLRLESRLLGVTSHLPAPFNKSAQQPWPWSVTADIEAGRFESRLADIASAHLQQRNGALAGSLYLGDDAARADTWPIQPGFSIDADVPRIDPLAWQQAVAPLMVNGASTPNNGDGQVPLTVSLTTPCVVYQDECLGSVSAKGGVNEGRIDMD